MDTRLNRRAKKEVWIMDPATDLYYSWLTIIAVPVMYNLMMLITRACFNELQESFTTLWIVVDYSSDFMYLADTFVRSRTGTAAPSRAGFSTVSSLSTQPRLAHSMPNPLAYMMAFSSLSLSFSRLLYSGSSRTLKQVCDVGNLRTARRGSEHAAEIAHFVLRFLSR